MTDEALAKAKTISPQGKKQPPFSDSLAIGNARVFSRTLALGIDFFTYWVCCQWSPKNPCDALANLNVEWRNIEIYSNFIYLEMIQRLKQNFQWSLIFVTSVFAQKFVYLITRKVYVYIKLNNTSVNSKLRAGLLK